MIQRLTLRDFKAFHSISVDLRSLTVLVGPNGVGKTSVLAALDVASRLATFSDYGGHVLAPFDRVLVGAYRARSMARSPDARTFGMDLTLPGDRCFSFDATLEERGLSTVTARLSGPGLARTLDLQLSGNAPPAHARDFFSDPAFAELGPARVLRLHPPAIAAPALVPKGAALLDDDGGGLAVVLEAMAVQRDGTLEAVETAMATVVPGFERVHFVRGEKASLEDGTIVKGTGFDDHVERTAPATSLDLQFRRVGRIPAAQASEGTLLVLALLALLHSPRRPRLLLLDDLDRALHPRAQVELVQLLKGLISTDPRLQIVCTAHSPMIVAGCASDEVVRLDFDPDRAPVVVPLDANPEWMTPSEIMSDYFGIERVGASELLQRYALIAGDPERSAAEDAEMKRLRRRLVGLGADPGWAPVARRSAKGKRR